MSVLSGTDVIQRGDSRQLVVLLHGWTLGRRSLADVQGATEAALPDADLIVPQFPTNPLTNADPIRISEEVLDAVDAAWEARERSGKLYEEIVFVGHSSGALLLRKAYVFGRGVSDDATIGLAAQPRDWISRVSRIVLLAGTNRGWSLSPKPRHMAWWVSLGLRSAELLLGRLPVGKFIKAMRRGAPYVANLRIQWLRLSRAEMPLPVTVQLLGSVDDVVSWEDNVDLQSSRGFVYLRVPNTGHVEVTDFSGSAGERRKAKFLEALTTDRDALQSDFIDELSVDEDVQQIVFVMHGIRDRGFWREEIAHRLKQTAADAGHKIETVISSYGYFPMLRFLLLDERQRNVRWFMDQYTEALARYPNAEMGFIGHSNGTYLLASALQRYQSCKFSRVVFAGSVVRTSFPWQELVDKQRVGAVCNFVATADVVVGVFPGFYELVGMADLGSAGHDGFRDDEGQRYAVTFIRGGHGAALVEEAHQPIVDFVLGGPKPVLNPELLASARSGGAVWLSKLNWLVWLVLATVLVLCTWIIGTHSIALAVAFAAALVAILSTV